MRDMIYGLFGFVAYTVGGILPFYAAYKDFKADEFFWGIVDIATLVIGVIRGIMYFIGWL